MYENEKKNIYEELKKYNEEEIKQKSGMIRKADEDYFRERISKIKHRSIVNPVSKELRVYQLANNLILRINSGVPKYQIPNQIKENIDILFSIIDGNDVYKIESVLLAPAIKKYSDFWKERKKELKEVLNSRVHLRHHIYGTKQRQLLQSFFNLCKSQKTSLNYNKFDFLVGNNQRSISKHYVIFNEESTIKKIEELISKKKLNDIFIEQNLPKLKESYEIINKLELANIQIDTILRKGNIYQGVDYKKLEKLLKSIKNKNEAIIKQEKNFFDKTIKKITTNKKYQQILSEERLEKIRKEKERLVEMRKRAIYILKENGKISEEVFNFVVKNDSPSYNVPNHVDKQDVIEAERLIEGEIRTLEFMENDADKASKTR